MCTDMHLFLRAQISSPSSHQRQAPLLHLSVSVSWLVVTQVTMVSSHQLYFTHHSPLGGAAEVLPGAGAVQALSAAVPANVVFALPSSLPARSDSDGVASTHKARLLQTLPPIQTQLPVPQTPISSHTSSQSLALDRNLVTQPHRQTGGLSQVYDGLTGV